MKELNLAILKLTDKKLSVRLAANNHEKFESINISYNDITSHGVKFLLSKFSLITFLLNANKIDEVALVNIAAHTTLQVLDMIDNLISDKGIRVLSTHNSLKVLLIDSLPITNKSFKYLANMPALEVLHSVDNNVEDQGIH